MCARQQRGQGGPRCRAQRPREAGGHAFTHLTPSNQILRLRLGFKGESVARAPRRGTAQTNLLQKKEPPVGGPLWMAPWRAADPCGNRRTCNLFVGAHGAAKSSWRAGARAEAGQNAADSRNRAESVWEHGLELCAMTARWSWRPQLLTMQWLSLLPFLFGVVLPSFFEGSPPHAPINRPNRFAPRIAPTVRCS